MDPQAAWDDLLEALGQRPAAIHCPRIPSIATIVRSFAQRTHRPLVSRRVSTPLAPRSFTRMTAISTAT